MTYEQFIYWLCGYLTTISGDNDYYMNIIDKLKKIKDDKGEMLKVIPW